VKSIIYYFTGTGNSLAAAKKIAASLGDCELVPIASLQKTNGNIVPPAERVGIVCPVYFSGLPAMVATFAGRMDPAAVKYAFAVVTNGGGGGSAALRQIDSILRKRQGRRLDAGFAVTMPGNYILMYSSPAGKEQEEILSKADTEIAKITGPVIRCERRDLPSSFVTRVLYTLIYPWFTSHVHTDRQKITLSMTSAHPAGYVRLSARQKISSWWKESRSGSIPASSAAGASITARCRPSRLDPKQKNGYGTGTHP